MGQVAKNNVEFKQAWQDEFSQMKRLGSSLSLVRCVEFRRRIEALEAEFLPEAIEYAFPSKPSDQFVAHLCQQQEVGSDE